MKLRLVLEVKLERKQRLIYKTILSACTAVKTREKKGGIQLALKIG